MTTQATKKKKVGAAWLRTSKDERTDYVSIVISGGLNPDINLVMFKNNYKEKDEQPDYILYLSAPREAAAAAARKPGPAPFPGEEEAAAVAAAEAEAEEMGGDDDIPF